MFHSVFNKLTDNHLESSISSKLRRRRFSIFLKKLSVQQGTRILDVGGTSQTWIGTGLEKNVTLLNLHQPKKGDLEAGLACVKGNALDMNMYKKNEFDVVYSNSVIEHVGNRKNQLLFADEVQRVGKSYWVQTPNKYFPVEPHFLFPFFQFMPEYLKKEIAIRWPYSHFKKWSFDRERILEELSQIQLLSGVELHSLFEKGHLYKEKFWGVTKSYVVYGSTG